MLIINNRLFGRFKMAYGFSYCKTLFKAATFFPVIEGVLVEALVVSDAIKQGVEFMMNLALLHRCVAFRCVGV